jgi:hypothetical protein
MIDFAETASSQLGSIVASWMNNKDRSVCSSDFSIFWNSLSSKSLALNYHPNFSQVRNFLEVRCARCGFWVGPLCQCCLRHSSREKWHTIRWSQRLLDCGFWSAEHAGLAVRKTLKNFTLTSFIRSNFSVSITLIYSNVTDMKWDFSKNNDLNLSTLYVCNPYINMRSPVYLVACRRCALTACGFHNRALGDALKSL